MKNMYTLRACMLAPITLTLLLLLTSATFGQVKTDLPVADRTIEVDKNTKQISFLGVNDFGAKAGDYSVTVVSKPGAGTAKIMADGMSITYIRKGFGDDSFKIEVCNGNGDCKQAIITIADRTRDINLRSSGGSGQDVPR